MKKGKVRHIHVEPSDNGGATVKIHRFQSQNKAVSTGGYDNDADDENLTAQSPEEAGQHVTNALRSHMAKHQEPDADDRGRKAIMAALNKKAPGGY